MNERTQQEYVSYRLSKSQETYDAALILYRNKKYNSTVNRLYYACFYAVSALLIHHSLSAKSHSGVKTQFFLHFIKTKAIDFKYSQLYSNLFSWRQESDYGDFIDFNQSDIEPLLIPVQELINEVERQIN